VTRVLAFIAACLFAGACAAQPPHKLTLTYELSYDGIVAAEMTDVLEHEGKRFSLSSEGRGEGIGALLYRGTARRWCRGGITRAGLRPLEYREQRGNNPASVAKFDWAGKTLTLEHDGKSETTKLVPGIQDRLSFLYNFAFEAAPDLRPGKEIKVTVTDGRGLTQFQYVVAAPEMLKTPAGEFETVHLVKQRENSEDKRTELWFARDRDYLPVRILVVDKNGARMVQVLTHIGS
jgi:Protein of unknown function (DUF3108)